MRRWIDNRNGDITSVLIGASRASQILDNVRTIENLEFNDGERAQIEEILM